MKSGGVGVGGDSAVPAAASIDWLAFGGGGGAHALANALARAALVIRAHGNVTNAADAAAIAGATLRSVATAVVHDTRLAVAARQAVDAARVAVATKASSTAPPWLSAAVSRSKVGGGGAALIISIAACALADAAVFATVRALDDAQIIDAGGAAVISLRGVDAGASTPPSSLIFVNSSAPALASSLTSAVTGVDALVSAYCGVIDDGSGDGGAESDARLGKKWGVRSLTRLFRLFSHFRGSALASPAPLSSPSFLMRDLTAVRSKGTAAARAAAAALAAIANSFAAGGQPPPPIFLRWTPFFLDAASSESVGPRLRASALCILAALAAAPPVGPDGGAADRAVCAMAARATVVDWLQGGLLRALLAGGADTLLLTCGGADGGDGESRYGGGGGPGGAEHLRALGALVVRARSALASLAESSGGSTHDDDTAASIDVAAGWTARAATRVGMYALAARLVSASPGVLALTRSTGGGAAARAAAAWNATFSRAVHVSDAAWGVWGGGGVAHVRWVAGGGEWPDAAADGDFGDAGSVNPPPPPPPPYSWVGSAAVPALALESTPAPTDGAHATLAFGVLGIDRGVLLPDGSSSDGGGGGSWYYNNSNVYNQDDDGVGGGGGGGGGGGSGDGGGRDGRITGAYPTSSTRVSDSAALVATLLCVPAAITPAQPRIHRHLGHAAGSGSGVSALQIAHTVCAAAREAASTANAVCACAFRVLDDDGPFSLKRAALVARACAQWAALLVRAAAARASLAASDAALIGGSESRFALETVVSDASGDRLPAWSVAASLLADAADACVRALTTRALSAAIDEESGGAAVDAAATAAAAIADCVEAILPVFIFLNRRKGLGGGSIDGGSKDKRSTFARSVAKLPPPPPSPIRTNANDGGGAGAGTGASESALAASSAAAYGLGGVPGSAESYDFAAKRPHAALVPTAPPPPANVTGDVRVPPAIGRRPPPSSAALGSLVGAGGEGGIGGPKGALVSARGGRAASVGTGDTAPPPPPRGSSTGASRGLPPPPAPPPGHAARTAGAPLPPPAAPYGRSAPMIRRLTNNTSSPAGPPSDGAKDAAVSVSVPPSVASAGSKGSTAEVIPPPALPLSHHAASGESTIVRALGARAGADAIAAAAALRRATTSASFSGHTATPAPSSSARPEAPPPSTGLPQFPPPPAPLTPARQLPPVDVAMRGTSATVSRLLSSLGAGVLSFAPSSLKSAREVGGDPDSARSRTFNALTLALARATAAAIFALGHTATASLFSLRVLDALSSAWFQAHPASASRAAVGGLLASLLGAAATSARDGADSTRENSFPFSSHTGSSGDFSAAASFSSSAAAGPPRSRRVSPFNWASAPASLQAWALSTSAALLCDAITTEKSATLSASSGVAGGGASGDDDDDDSSDSAAAGTESSALPLWTLASDAAAAAARGEALSPVSEAATTLASLAGAVWSSGSSAARAGATDGSGLWLAHATPWVSVVEALGETAALKAVPPLPPAVAAARADALAVAVTALLVPPTRLFGMRRTAAGAPPFFLSELMPHEATPALLHALRVVLEQFGKKKGLEARPQKTPAPLPPFRAYG